MNLTAVGGEVNPQAAATGDLLLSGILFSLVPGFQSKITLLICHKSPSFVLRRMKSLMMC